MTEKAQNPAENPEVNASCEQPETEAVVESASEDADNTSSDISIASLQEKCEALEAKADENWQRFLRAQAETDNVQRRAKRDVENAHKYALEKFLESLLPVLDSFDQGLQQTDEASSALLEGMQLTQKQLVSACEKTGLEVLDPVGDVFDPSFHEALSMQPSEEVKPNHIMTVFQKGYALNGRVLRPARVVVAQKA